MRTPPRLHSRGEFTGRCGGADRLRYLAILALAFYLALAGRVPAAPAQSSTDAVPRIGGHFTLTALDGSIVTEHTYQGRWQLIYFGYTSCPDVCPAVLTDMSAALGQLGTAADRIEPVFISLDPDRDDAQSVATYLKNFSPRIIGLVGSPEQTRAAAQAFRVYYQARALGNGAYTVDHSSYLFLLKPDGSFAALLSGNLPAHSLTDQLRLFVQ